MGSLVVGMHLNGQVLARVDKLDEQRKPVAEALVVFLTHQLLLHLSQHLIEGLALALAIGNDGLVAWHS